MRYREPFKLFHKKLKAGKTIYYYTTYDLFKNRKQYSTGETKKSKAYKYCYELFKNEELLNKHGEFFSKYVEDWFIYDKCPHIQSILARGKSFSKSNARQQRNRLLNSIIPYMENVPLNEISTRHIEEWMKLLKKRQLANITINGYLTTLRVIINFAYNIGDIKHTPIKSVRNLVNDSKERSTLTEIEVKKLFDPKTLDKVWYNKTYYLINYLAYSTGMRCGEIMALMTENVKKDHILVKHNWDRAFGLKSTKNGKSRIVPISKELYKQLKDHIEETKTEFLFMNARNNKPFTAPMLGRNLYHALEKIGVSQEERKNRNITFHSWRHYYNTKLIKKEFLYLLSKQL